uniref:50S ribosomal protein L27, chloroplastic n=1 Tax=Tetraselmis chuii TaxID=63592 RepID=A0A7S1T0B7_9CHLO|mmetsp:Transcript_38903/g.69655  ORF Transcript_38903/g.69655 Transcript_38903/m.69655 type:complete len:137 (+) Transcript_38903:271-681(+)
MQSLYRSSRTLGPLLSSVAEMSPSSGSILTQLCTRGSELPSSSFALSHVRWASKKQGGSTQNGRESQPKHLGCKLFDNHACKAGSIIVRQRGTRFFPGVNTGMGTDHTIFAKIAGVVRFHTHPKTKKRTISVVDKA